MDIFNMFDSVYGEGGFSLSETHYRTEENIFGGVNIYEETSMVGRTEENIFGGVNIYQEGSMVGRTEENIFGGVNIYQEGSMVGRTEENIFGGENIYQEGSMVGRTEENIFGGVNIYQEGGMVGRTEENIFGGENIRGEGFNLGAAEGDTLESDFSTALGEGLDYQEAEDIGYLAGQEINSFYNEDIGNSSTILGYSDPLAHIDKYIMSPMII